MTQTDDGFCASEAKVELSADGISWTDISGSSASVGPAEQTRKSGDGYTHSGDAAITIGGKREPVELEVNVVYTEGSGDPFAVVLAAYEADTPYYLRWSPRGGAGGDFVFTAAEAIITGIAPPDVDAGSGDPAMFAFKIKTNEITKSLSFPDDITGLALRMDASQLTGLVDGDLVSTWTDFSGNGRNATAAGGARPTYKTGILKGKPVLRFNGTANAMQTAAVDFTATQTMTVFAVVIPDTTAANRVIVELGNGSTTGFYCYHSQDGGGFNNSFSAGLLGDVGFSYEYNRCVILNTPAVVTGTYDKSSATHETYCYVNGSLAGAYTGSNNTNNFGNLALNIGSRNAASLWYKGDIAEIIIYNRTLTSTELARVHSYLLNKWMTSCIYGPSELADNAYSNSYTAYTLSSPFARTVFTTTATMLTVDVYNNIFSTFSTYATIGVWVDGVYTTTLTSLVDSTQTSFSIVLAGGLKTVVLVNGLQTKPGATVLGTFVTKVWSGNGVMTKSAPARSTLVVYGDSITIGGNATIPTSQAWVILVRAAYTGTMAIEAWGFRSLHDDAVDAPAIALLVARLAAAYSPAIIWLAIGFNDYYLAPWNAAAFGTAYAALLDALHAQFPAAVIYAQTMIEATDEADHGVGTLGAFRAQIAAAQGARAGWCTLVDGTGASFPQAPGDLADGIHPTTAGHVKYSDSVKTVLGI